MSKRYRSGEVISAIAREKQLALIQQVVAVDTQAAALIGLSGVILGLLFSSEFVIEHWNSILTAGAGLLWLGAVTLSYALLPRQQRFNPNVAKLHAACMHKDPDETRRVVVESINRAIAWNEAILKRKAFALRSGTLLLAVSVVCIGIRLIYLLET